jgi:hypothetical protein
MWLGMLPPGLVWDESAVFPMGPPKAPNIAQAQPICKRGTVLCCWAEPHSPHIPLFR